MPAKADADDGKGPVLLSYEPSTHPTNAIKEAGELLVEKSALEYVDEGAGLAAEAGFQPQAFSVRALRSPWRGVLDAASEHNASVVVMGSRSVSGPLAILGSTTDGVIHHARCPVLVVPPSE